MIFFLHIVILYLQYDHVLHMKSATCICEHFFHMIDTLCFNSLIHVLYRKEGTMKKEKERVKDIYIYNLKTFSTDI